MSDFEQEPIGRYYTPASVSALLVETMAGPPPRTLLDLAAGQGALWKAARSVWSDTHITTVDIDRSARPRKLENHVHVIGDALNSNLLGRRKEGSFEAALCNPPYFKPQWRDDYHEILKEAGLARAFGARVRVPAEALFVAQNIRYACEGGSVGLILPDGLLTGARYQLFREILLAEHSVERIIQLPRRVFVGTDAQTHILVLRKGLMSPSRIPLQKMNSDGRLTGTILVSRDEAIHRMDYSFHAPSHARAAVTLADLGATVTRGSFEPIAGQAGRETEFHTSNFPKGKDRLAVRLPSGNSLLDKGCAREGDILIARVDRKLYEKVCYVASGSMPLTTSVLRIRVSPAYRKLVLRALLSESGSKRLQATSRGVGARMLAQRDLLHMELEL